METDYQLLWILDGHTPRKCRDVLKWGDWLKRADRNVARSIIGDFLVSTIFLGTNQRLGKGVPILFETMVFFDDKPVDKYSRRYSTWDEAFVGHQAIMAQVEAEGRVFTITQANKCLPQ